jgi:aminoglycoside phosphotransferase (APT) family kinase protein
MPRRRGQRPTGSTACHCRGMCASTRRAKGTSKHPSQASVCSVRAGAGDPPARPSLASLSWPRARQLTAVARTLARGWRPVPAGRLPTGAAKAEWLADFVAREWVALGRPCSQAAVEKALSHAAERAAAFDPERAVLIHGDAHAHNLLLKPGLADGSTSFRLIDPEGLFSEPAHDLGVACETETRNCLSATPPQRRPDAAGRRRC